MRDAGLPVRDVMQNMIVFVRNDLEHEYKIPGEEIDIKNSVDVAELFLLATDSKIGQGFFRWVVGPRTVPDPSDPSGFKAGTLPHDTFGLLVDYEDQSITSFDGPTRTSGKFLDFHAASVAELFRVLYAAVEPGKTKIVGPLSEGAFSSAFT